MASIFKSIDTVTVNGSNLYLGGYIYDVNFKPSIGQEPSNLTISIVNENGVYKNPILTIKQPSQIRIGNLSLTMYPIKYRKKSSSQGKILEVEFVDASFNLDKIYVGLIKKHYNTPTQLKPEIRNNRIISNFYSRFTINKNFIILGRELHPCDVNRDGQLEPNEIRELDPCDPCPSCPPEKFEKGEKCDQLSYLKIFDVVYHFYEFLDGLAAMGKFTIEKPKIPEDKIKNYLRDYTGTARSVLSSWCADLAINYIFDASKNLLFFKDVSKDTKVNESAIKSLIGGTEIISEEIEESMENTYSHGSISLYERDGQLKNFNCSKSQSMVLPIITDFDYIGPRTRTVADKELDSLHDTVGAILGNYSEALRESFWLRKIYGVNDSQSARKMIEKLDLGKGSQNRASGYFESINKKMPELGNMVIIGVVEDPSKVKGELTAEEKLINQQFNTLVNNISNDIERNNFLKDQGFFLIAYHEKDNYEKRLETERKFFESLGRFYLREGYVRLCGITGSPEEVMKNTQINAGDGANANFYSKGFELSSLPISKYPYDFNGYVGCLLFPSTSKADALKNPPKSPFENLESKTVPSNPGKDIYYGSTILSVEREPVWSPDPNKLEEYKELLDKFQGFMLKEYGSDGRGYVPTSAYPGSIQEVLRTSASTIVSPAGDILPGNIRIYTMIPQNFSINWNWGKEHPTEKLGKELKENKGRKDPTTIAGLISKKCFNININNTFQIFAPPLSIQENIKEGNQSNDDPCDDYLKDRKPAYRIVLNQNYNTSKEVGKIQSVQENLPPVFDQETLKFELNYLNITDSDFKILTSQCRPDSNVLRQIHELYNVRQTDSIIDRFKKIKYQLKGIPNIDLPKALDLGLEELNFTYSSDGGICNISFSNSFSKTPSLDAIRAGISYSKLQHYSSFSPTKETST